MKLKLGFILRITSGGDDKSISINEDISWAKYVPDAGSYIEKLHNFDGTSKTVILVRFHGVDGYMISIIKARPEGSGRENDNTAAWIHFPAKIKISEDETYNIIQLVTNELSARKGINRTILEEVFSKEYEVKNTLLTATELIRSSKEGSIGYRYYGGKGSNYQLKELLGDSIAQSVYNKYKGIFFIDRLSEITMDYKEIQTDIYEICTIEPPQNIKYNFTPYIGSIHFTAPIEITKNTLLPIVLKKNGYADIKKEISVSNPNINIEPKECLRCIRKSWFHAYDCENNESLTLKISIRVDGQYFNNEILYVPENLNNHYNVEIQCNGYEPFKDNIEISDNVRIGLKAEEHEETFILPKQDGNGLDAHATIIIKTKKNSQSMPLKGYTVEGDKFLCYNNNIGLKIKWFFIGFISLFVIGALYQGYVAIDEFFDGHKLQLGWPIIVEKHIETITDEGKITPEPETEQPQVTNLDDKAIKYLNNNSVWIKDSLESYDITKGLFDAMNTLNLDLLTGEKYSTLKDKSSKFKSIVDAANVCRYENIDVQGLINGGHYNSNPSDKQITVSNYINWLNNAPNNVEKENSNTENSRITNKPKNNSNKASSTKSASPNKPNRNGAKVE